MAKLFGFEIKRKSKNLKSFAPPPNDDGAIPVSPTAGGAYGTYIDMEGQFKTEIDLINQYRNMSTQSECDAAIDDIVNESIVHADTEEPVVKLELNALGAPDNIKKKFEDAFEKINNLLNFNVHGYELFRKWYIDGRIYFHIITDEAKLKQGIQELRYLDPRKIKKVREVQTDRDAKVDGAELVKKVEEFFVYDENAGKPKTGVDKIIKIKKDAICYVNSGLFNSGKSTVISNLHKAIKPLNQLRMMEDAMVIYRISRAPERRLFYIDVGNLPKAKAEQYLADTMNRYRNKLVYNSETGEIKDERKHMSMLEDFWLPRREGGRGTEISTLPGGQNLGEMEDVIFFQTKLYKSLNVPPSRLESDSGFSLGRESEITRDELKFAKFIARLRNKFSEMFFQLLKTELILTGVFKEDDWEKIKHEVQIEYADDSYYREIKMSEMLLGRVDVLNSVSEYAGRYFSMDYIKRHVLQLTDKEIRDMQKQIDAEVDGGKLAKDATIEWGGGGGMGMGDEMGGELPPEGGELPPEQVPQQASSQQVPAEERILLTSEMNGNGSTDFSKLDAISTLLETTDKEIEDVS